MNRRPFSILALLFVSAVPLQAQQFKRVELPSGLPGDFWSCSTICPRGKLIASHRTEGIQVWDLATGREVSDLGVFLDGIHAMTFSPDATLLAVAGRNRGILVRDVPAGKWKYEWKDHDVSLLAFSRDGKTLGSASSQEAKLWDLRTGKELTSITWLVPSWESVFSRDLRTLVTTDHNDVVVWDVGAKKERLLEGHRGHIMGVAFGPDDKTLYTASTRTKPDESRVSEIRVWDVATAKPLAAWESPLTAIRSLAVSPDGKFLAVTGGDPYDSQSTLRLIDTTSGRAVPDLELTGQWLEPRFRPQGSWIIGSVKGETRMWEVLPPKK